MDEDNPRLVLAEANLAIASIARAVDGLIRYANRPDMEPRDVLPPSFFPAPPLVTDEHDRRRIYGQALQDICLRLSEICAQVAFVFPDHVEPALSPPVPLVLAPQPPPSLTNALIARPALVQVAKGLHVEAMLLPETCRTVSEVLDQIRGPMLCFVPAWGHFAIRLGSRLLHGNIGRIFPEGTCRPTGVKSCQKCTPGHVRKKCSYYHDPAKFAICPEPAAVCPGTNIIDTAPNQIRNFVADSFSYRSRFSAPRRAERYGRRRLGSVDSLRLDLEGMSELEINLFLDQVAHDLVCAAVLLHNRPLS